MKRISIRAMKRAIRERVMSVVAFMGSHGLHGHVIARVCGVSMSTVYYICKLKGIRLRDYRDGKGSEALWIVQTARRSITGARKEAV